MTDIRLSYGDSNLVIRQGKSKMKEQQLDDLDGSDI